MAIETQVQQPVDYTGTSDFPSPEAGLPYAREQADDWGRRAGRLFAENPGYGLAAAAVAGFVLGRVVKRLLS